MRWRYLIACSCLALACSDSHRSPGEDAPSESVAQPDTVGNEGGAGHGPAAVPAAGAGSARDRENTMAPAKPSAPDTPAGGGENGGGPNPADPEPQAGASGVSPDNNAGTADPGNTQELPDPPTGVLAAALAGHWYRDALIGNCLGVRDYYSFASGAVQNDGIDHNACSGDRLLSQAAGSYTLDGRELVITLQGAGSDRAPDMAAPLGDVMQRVRRMTIAIGQRVASVDRPAQTYLDAEAFGSSDGQRFGSVRSDVFLAADGSTLFAQKAVLGLQLNRSLRGLAPGGPLRVQLTVQLAQSDPADPTQILADEITLAYDAVVREEHGWHRIMPVALDGLGSEHAIAAWDALLMQAGVDTHPDWARRALQFQFYPAQRYQPDNVTVLSSTLPEYGHWTRADRAPFVPGAAP